jgi:hypothetical protein
MFEREFERAESAIDDVIEAGSAQRSHRGVEREKNLAVVAGLTNLL